MPGIIRAVEVAQNTLGPLSFFKAVREDEQLRRMPGQEYWSWPQWDRFFELAEEHGMNACDQYQAGGKTVTLLHFGALGTSILMDWRRVQAAKASGQSSYGFHMQEERRRAEEKRKMEEMEQYQQRRIAAEAQASADKILNKPQKRVSVL